MDVEALKLFADVTHRGGFSQVARDRGVDPSSISRAIAALEAEVGARLFHRSTRRLTITEAGALYLEKIEPFLDVVGEAGDEVRAMARGPAGILRLTASVAFGQACLTPLLPAFRQQFPGLGVHLLLSDANLDLVAERIDLAIRLAPSITADVVGAKLFDTHYRVCASQTYLAAGPPLRAPPDLAEHRCLLFALPDYSSRWRFRRPGGRITEVAVAGDIVASSAVTLLDCARNGLGPALLPNWLVDRDIAAGTLVDCFPDYAAAARSFDTAAWLLYPSRTFLPHKVRASIDFIRAKLTPTGMP